MKKIVLGVEYDGTLYHGWQRQKHVLSIQEEIEHALSIIADQKVEIISAGRTDTGVHSTGQVIHFNTTAVRKMISWTKGVNSYLSKYISILWAKEISEEFHARYSAITRSYRYIIYNHNFRSAIFYNRATHIYKKLDVNRMNFEAQFLLGEHDFTSFRSFNCQANSPFRNIIKLDVQRIHNWVIIDITANSFLYHMVRNIVGSLIDVGMLKKRNFWMKELLKSKNRSKAGAMAPAKGLYFTYVEYPTQFNLPKKIHNPIFFI